MSEQNSTEKRPSAPFKPKKRSSFGLFKLLFVLLVLAAMALASWLGWQQYQALLAQLNSLQHSQANSQSELSARTSELQQALDTLKLQQQQFKTQLDTNTEQVEELAGADHQDWVLAEAEYLLRLANQRLTLEQDWHSALAMLKAADDILDDVHNPRLAPVRATLAEEMLALRNAPSLDKEGAVLRLQAIQNNLPKLPWLPSQLEAHSDQSAKPTEMPADMPWYQRFWQKLTLSFKDLVHIRKRTEADNSPLSPDQRYYLQQNMYRMLEQAQVALLREEPALYEHSLQRVSQWIHHYLLADHPQTQATLQAVQELLTWEVRPERPEISQSLLKLQKIIEQRRRGGEA